MLGERVTEVRASKTLRSSPARLVAGDAGAPRELQRVQRLLNRDYEVTPAVLELNRSHPLIRNLVQLHVTHPHAALAPLIVEQLYDSALLLDGLHPNPAQMVPRIQQLMEVASSTSSKDENTGHG